MTDPGAPREYVAVPGDARRAAKAVLSRRYRSLEFVVLMVFPGLVLTFGVAAQLWWLAVVGICLALMLWLPERQRTMRRMAESFAPGTTFTAVVVEEGLQSGQGGIHGMADWADFAALQVYEGIVVLSRRATLTPVVLPAALFDSDDLDRARSGIAERRRRSPAIPEPGGELRTAVVTEEYRRALAKAVPRQWQGIAPMLFGFAVLIGGGAYFVATGFAGALLVVVPLLLVLLWAISASGRIQVDTIHPAGCTFSLVFGPGSFTFTDGFGASTTVPFETISSLRRGGPVVLLALRDQADILALPGNLFTDEDLATVATAIREG